LLIKNRLRESRSLDEQLYQEICCLEVKCREVICNGKKSGAKEFFVEIPLLEAVGPYAIKYFGTVDRLTPFNRRNYLGKLFGNASPWTGKKPFYTLVGEEAVLGNLPTTAFKYMCGIFLLEDPLNGKCFMQTENDNYPVSMNMAHELELIVIKQLMSTINIRPDTQNTTRDDSPANPTQQPR
jgi:hypothetical protein